MIYAIDQNPPYHFISFPPIYTTRNFNGLSFLKGGTRREREEREQEMYLQSQMRVQTRYEELQFRGYNCINQRSKEKRLPPYNQALFQKLMWKTYAICLEYVWYLSLVDYHTSLSAFNHNTFTCSTRIINILTIRFTQHNEITFMLFQRNSIYITSETNWNLRLLNC